MAGYASVNMPSVGDFLQTADVFSRAVVKPAPAVFSVETLAPLKIDGSHYMCMRITPMYTDRVSLSSKSSQTEYEIMRRWEDCLYFQDMLEREYSQLARSKKNRLKKGKGVRKNDVYINSDRASSWDSLPPGPAPESVVLDIHDLVPKLTKKGTLFRTSQSTIDQRQVELKAFMAAFWRDDVPTLLDEYRQEDEVRAFFALWQKDRDIARKLKSPPKKKPASTIYSFYAAERGSTDTVSSTATRRTRAVSSASSSDASTSSGSSRNSLASSVYIASDDRSVPFGHNPTQDSNKLAVLPEMVEFKKRGKTHASAARDSWMSTTSGMSFVDDLNVRLPDEEERRLSSRMSMASIATFRTDISSEGVVPRYYIPEHSSRMSVATFRTDASADGVLPRPDSRATISRSSLFSDTDSVLDSGFLDSFPRPCSFVPDSPIEDADSLAYHTAPSSPIDSLRPASPEAPRTPVGSYLLRRQEALAARRGPSPSSSLRSGTASVLSDCTSSSRFSDSTGTTITPSRYSFSSSCSSETTATSVASIPISPLVIKAVYNSSIILLKVDADADADDDRAIGLQEVRARLRHKFKAQENEDLPEGFALAYVTPASKFEEPTTKTRSSGEPISIAKEADWEQLRASLDGTKLTLRIVS
ncbi:unnamed protein product [Mycena citricolor]|uniref:PX domain-containing protein n=1 Tax=Mycena citricolor TaxID=2018698 RepID=A0AAD2Q2Y6_9AGAR|nr:unnamed protein product [Mycena citricolor]